MLRFTFKHPGATEDHLGLIPFWLNEYTEAEGQIPAREQLDFHYQHGGGWRPFEGFNMRDDGSIVYPGDRPLPVLAEAQLGQETIRMYPNAWVAIVQPDGKFEVCRMD